MKTKLSITIFLILNIGITLRAQNFFTQSILHDLNSYQNGFGAFANHISANTPSGYGTLLGFRFWDGGGSDWRSQLAFGTDNNFYYRQSTNTNGANWTNWYKVYHSGNFNNGDVDLLARGINCSSLNIQGTGTTLVYDAIHVGSGTSWGGSGAAITLGGGNLKSARILGYTFDGNDHRGSLYLQTKMTNGNWYSGIVLKHTTGFVGIGTEDPKNLLDVKGTIHAQEVKVDMNNWSDFVFHPSYQLKPLIEVEKFIKTNGHLEDIPSATEVEQNGVNVGEMQAKLLQKVEELTLYVIELKKEIEQLKQSQK
jgi:hypothetical protein